MMLTSKPFTAYNVTFPYVFWDNFFTEEELIALEAYLDAQPREKAVLASMDPAGQNNEKIRITSVSMIDVSAENNWIFNRLLQLTDFINSQFYNYDLLGFDYIQYTVYDQVGSHYEYLMDMVMDDKIAGKLVLPRKLSFSLILSDSKDYQGGDFEITTGGKTVMTPEQRRGRVIAFPSYVLHRVTPITKGVRKSLVFWACGPKFR